MRNGVPTFDLILPGSKSRIVNHKFVEHDKISSSNKTCCPIYEMKYDQAVLY